MCAISNNEFIPAIVWSSSDAAAVNDDDEDDEEVATEETGAIWNDGVGAAFKGETFKA